jgi:hypothetical protein
MESLACGVLTSSLDCVIRGARLGTNAEFRSARNQPPAAQNGTRDISRGSA